MFKSTGKNGFTLIELLVVIAIIGLLSTTIMTSLNSARSKARDTRRKADLDAVRKALELYYDKYGTYQVSGGGYAGRGNGWLAYEKGPYPKAVTRVLYEKRLLSAPIVEDPTQNPGYMIYICDNGQRYAISATLENPSSDDIAYIQTTCNGTGGNGTYTRYKKNYAVGN